MDFKKIRKAVAYFFGWIALVTCSLIARLLPVEFTYGFARNIGVLGYFIAVRQRRIALESLKIAFGKEKTLSEIKQIAKDCFIFMAKAGLEISNLIDKPDLIRARIHIFRQDYLKEALAKGKGIILVSAHFGNFPLMLARLGLEGYQVNSVMRPMKDKRVEKIFDRQRKQLNVKGIYTIPRHTCVATSLRNLRNNELLFIPLDQNFGTGGVFVDFFGKKAATAVGPVILAQRTQATILPCFIIRQDDDTHRIVFEPPLELIKGKDEFEELVLNIQRLTNIIESYIRRYPAEWGWIHRRWKSRPKTEKGGV